MKATLIVAIYGICATALLTFYAVYQWLEPMTPLVIGAIAVIIPSFAIVFALEEEARPPKPNVMMLVQTLMIAGVFGLALPALWNVPNVRAKALDSFASRKSVERALTDRNSDVADAACRLMFEPRIGYRGDQILATLYPQPEKAIRCIKAAPAGGLSDDVTAELVLAWHQGLIDGEPNACETVPVLASMPISSSNTAAILLDCSLQSSDGATRKCCADHLSVAYPGEKLFSKTRSAAELVKDFGTSAPLLASAFNEEIFVKGIAPIPAQLKLQTEKYRQLSVELSCSTVTGEEGHDADRRYLKWLFDQNVSCLPKDTSKELDVLRACNEFLTYSSADRKDLGAALCQANLAVRKQEEALAARRRSGADLSDFANEIDLGRSTLQGRELGAANIGNLVESGRMQEMSPQEMALFQRSMGDTQARAEALGAQNMLLSQGAAKQMAEGGFGGGNGDKLEKMQKESLDTMQLPLQKALGYSAEELAAGLDDEKNMSPEMLEKLEARKKKGSKGAKDKR